MTLRDLGGAMRRAWVLVAATTLLGALAGWGLSQLTTPVYQAHGQLFVSVQSADDVSGRYDGDLYVQARIKSYVLLVDTPGVLEPVIEELELDMSPSQLAERVDAQNPPETVLITVLADDGDANQSAEIADATAESLADEIVRLETTDSGAQPVKAEGVLFADVPTTPVKPRTMFNILMGALLGLLTGLGVAVLRAHRDTSIKSVPELQLATNSTVLGAIAYDPDAGHEPLAVLRDEAQADAYRTVRTNLKFVSVDHPQRSLVVTSPAAQEGKSVTAANLAVALAQSGSRVLLIDADLRSPSLSSVLGVDSSPGLTDVLIERTNPHQRAASVIVARQQWGPFDFLPPGHIPPNATELLGSQQATELLRYLTAQYDVVILDAPPLLLASDAAILGAVADGVILVTRHGRTRREQVEEATATLARVNGRLLGAVLNCVPRERSPRRAWGRPGHGRQDDGGSTARPPGTSRHDQSDATGSPSTAPRPLSAAP